MHNTVVQSGVVKSDGQARTRCLLLIQKEVCVKCGEFYFVRLHFCQKPKSKLIKRKKWLLKKGISNKQRQIHLLSHFLSEAKKMEAELKNHLLSEVWENGG